MNHVTHERMQIVLAQTTSTCLTWGEVITLGSGLTVANQIYRLAYLARSSWAALMMPSILPI